MVQGAASGSATGTQTAEQQAASILAGIQSRQEAARVKPHEIALSFVPIIGNFFAQRALARTQNAAREKERSFSTLAPLIAGIAERGRLHKLPPNVIKGFESVVGADTTAGLIDYSLGRAADPAVQARNLAGGDLASIINRAVRQAPGSFQQAPAQPLAPAPAPDLIRALPPVPPTPEQRVQRRGDLLTSVSGAATAGVAGSPFQEGAALGLQAGQEERLGAQQGDTNALLQTALFGSSNNVGQFKTTITVGPSGPTVRIEPIEFEAKAERKSREKFGKPARFLEMDEMAILNEAVVQDEAFVAAQVQPLPAELSSRIGAINAAITLANDIQKTFSSAFTGPLRGRLGAAAQVLNITSEQETEFRALIDTLAKVIVRSRTGVAAGPQELALERRNLPSVTDPPEVFRSRFKVAIRGLLANREGLLSAVRASRGQLDAVRKVAPTMDLSITGEETPQAPSQTAPEAPSGAAPADIESLDPEAFRFYQNQVIADAIRKGEDPSTFNDEEIERRIRELIR